MKELNAKGRQLVRGLIETTHVEDVLLICQDHCERQALHCDTVPDYRAIAREWRRAAKHIAKAIEEVAQ